MYGTFQRQYKTHKSALEKYSEFEHLKHEDNTPKTEGELFYPEMHYENKLKDLQKQVSDMRYNAELNSNSTKSSGSSINNNDMSINQDNYAENGDNILNAEFGSKKNYTAVRRIELSRCTQMFLRVFVIRNGSYNIKELHETCAAISACEYIDVREKYRRIVCAAD